MKQTGESNGNFSVDGDTGSKTCRDVLRIVHYGVRSSYRMHAQVERRSVSTFAETARTIVGCIGVNRSAPIQGGSFSSQSLNSWIALAVFVEIIFYEISKGI